MYKIEFLVQFQAHFVQTWQPPLLQWVQTYTKSIFATGLHKANFVQIRFFIQCKACQLNICFSLSSHDRDQEEGQEVDLKYQVAPAFEKLISPSLLRNVDWL